MGGFEAVLLILGAVALYGFTQASAAGHLIFFPDNVTGLTFDGATPVVFADILIQNTSNSQFTINSIAANATSQGSLVGNVSNFTPVTVPPNNQVVFPITIRMQLLGIADDIISAIQNGHINKELSVEGYVNANGAQLPVKVTYQIGI